ncbi:hypothetical protein PITC_047220 [Penicillium italicum]|uniref:Uncharacterized protein n=1 Tax=Penicillium italicum TaxID=40296 RepID=A0A0A2L4U6_PENIT|nr:hypothetical protein PITC_047220 [Penicillium italicum]
MFLIHASAAALALWDAVRRGVTVGAQDMSSNTGCSAFRVMSSAPCRLRDLELASVVILRARWPWPTPAAGEPKIINRDSSRRHTTHTLLKSTYHKLCFLLVKVYALDMAHVYTTFVPSITFFLTAQQVITELLPAYGASRWVSYSACRETQGPNHFETVDGVCSLFFLLNCAVNLLSW